VTRLIDIARGPGLSIYTDASFLSDGRAGIGFIVVDHAQRSVTEHRARITARSSMAAEVLAVSHACDHAATLRRPATIYTDCTEVEDAVNQPGRRRRDAWIEVSHWLKQRLDETHCVLSYVEGHSGNLGNTRADQLAKAAARGEEPRDPSLRCPDCGEMANAVTFRLHVTVCPIRRQRVTPPPRTQQHEHQRKARRGRR